MKRIIVYLFLASLVILSGCRGMETVQTESVPEETAHTEPATQPDILLTQPPKMIVRCAEQEAVVGTGNYTWNCEEGSTITCGLSPGSLWEGDPTLVTDAETAELTWSVMPDTISVRCWSNAGSTETWDVEYLGEIHENVLTIHPEYQIYEISASWNSHDSYSGTASYAIFLLPPE